MMLNLGDMIRCCVHEFHSILKRSKFVHPLELSPFERLLSRDVGNSQLPARQLLQHLHDFIPRKLFQSNAWLWVAQRSVSLFPETEFCQSRQQQVQVMLPPIIPQLESLALHQFSKAFWQGRPLREGSLGEQDWQDGDAVLEGVTNLVPNQVIFFINAATAVFVRNAQPTRPNDRDNHGRGTELPVYLLWLIIRHAN